MGNSTSWLSFFISSRMKELAEERRLFKDMLAQYGWQGWLWEMNAGARDADIRTTYLHEVEACDIFVGLFWHGYGQYTIEEFEHARKHHKPILLYEKKANPDQRDAELTQFLERVQRVSGPDSFTVFRFETPAQLIAQAYQDILRFLITALRKNNYPARRRIAQILGQMGDPAVLTLLRDAYHQEPDATTRPWLALSIGYMHTPAAKEALLHFKSWEEQLSQSRAERHIAERGIEQAMQIV